MLYLWISNGTSKTGRLLAARLNVHNVGSRVPPEGTTKCICWGARLPRLKRRTYRRLRNEIEYINYPWSIKQNADKANSLLIMQRMGVSVPECWPSTGNIHFHRCGYPIVGRTRNHMGGSGFFMCRNHTDVERALRNNAVIFMKYIDKDSEWRIHVFNNKIVRCSKKIQNPDSSFHHDYIWSHEKGWIFEDKYILGRLERNGYRTPEYVMDEAKLALDSLNLDFGAVDIIVKNNNAYVLEVNTGPSLNLYGRRLYMRLFKEAGFHNLNSHPLYPKPCENVDWIIGEGWRRL